MLIEKDTTIQPHIEEAIQEASQDKSSPITFAPNPYDSNQKIIFTPHEGFNKAYCRSLREWAYNTERKKDDSEIGYMLEIFYKELLQKIFPQQEIFLSPSSLDNKVFENIPPADIVISNRLNEYSVDPLVMISSKASNKPHGEINLLLNCPEITLCGIKLFNNKVSLFRKINNFINSNNPQTFLDKIVKKEGDLIKYSMLTDLLNLRKQNCESKTTNKKRIKVKNRIANRRINYMIKIIMS